MNFGHFIRYWTPVLAWMLVIFAASSDLMSARQTSRFIGPFLLWLIPDISATGIAAAQFFLRKCAHVAEYAILGALLWRALRARAGNAWRFVFVSALLMAFVCAVLDEFRQSFVASRTGSPIDVLIDTAGALIGVMICWSLARKL